MRIWPLRLLTGLGIAALLVMVAATLVAVVTRFSGTTGFEWSYEVAGIAFVWTTFLGAALSESRRENAAFEVLKAMTPQAWRFRLDRLNAIVLLAVGAMLLASGWAALSRSGFVPTPLLRWPGFVQGAAAPVLGLCLLAFGLHRLVDRRARSELPPPASVAREGAGTPL